MRWQRERRGWLGDAWVSCIAARVSVNTIDNRSAPNPSPIFHNSHSGSGLRVAQVSSDGGMLTLDTGALHTKWIRDIFDEQARAIAAGIGACAPNIAPAECPGGADSQGNCAPSCGAPPWAIAAIVVPYNMWRYHGDIRLLRAAWPNMQLFMEWLDSTADNSTGLVMQDGLADWCPPARVATDPHSVSSFSQFMGWKMLAEVADALGHKMQAATIRTRLAQLRSAYRRAYYNSSSGCYSDSATQTSHGSPMEPNVQTSNSMALWLGIPNKAEEQKVIRALVEDVEHKGHHLSTGIIGTRVLLPSLPMETAYALAVQDTYPGPGNFVANGATVRCVINTLFNHLPRPPRIHVLLLLFDVYSAGRPCGSDGKRRHTIRLVARP